MFRTGFLKILNFALIVVMILGLAITLPGGVVKADIGSNSVFQSGGDRLQEMQQFDGGWDWPLEYVDPLTPSPYNTLAPIMQGVVAAYYHTNDADYETVLLNAGAHFLDKINTTKKFSPTDGFIAVDMDVIFGGTTYVDYVMDNYYAPLAAGTYVRDGVTYDTASYIAFIRNGRTGTQANMAAWDIGVGLAAAARIGADTAPWVDGVKAEINELDGDNSYYDVIGLAGALYGLAYAGEEFDPTAGEHADAASLADLAEILVSYQLDSGGFAWSKNYVIENDANEDVQATSYAMLALDKLNHDLYLENLQSAADYLLSVQLPTGGWDNYPAFGEYEASGENNEVTAEALWAISAAYPELWVCESGDCGHPGFSFNSLHEAVAAAISGTVIHIADGEYLEPQMVVGKSLTIIGESQSGTVLKPLNDTGSSGDARGWFVISIGNEFNLSYLTLNGEGKSVYQAIRSYSTGEIDAVTFANIAYPGYAGMGVAIMNANMSITNSTFTNIGRIGVIFFGAGTTDGYFAFNTYTGKGDGDWLDYGVELGGGAVATIENNTITGNTGVAASDSSTSAGILATDLYGSGTSATILNNEIHGCTSAIAIGYDGTDITTAVVYHNDLSGNEYGVSTTTPAVPADENWWGSVAGPAVGFNEGNVEISLWCGDAACSFLMPQDGTIDLPEGISGEEIQAAINNAPAGTTIIIPAGTYAVSGGFTINTPNVTVLLSDGVVLLPSSPCFTVAADGISIIAPVGQAVCQPSGGDPGINVPGAVNDLTISGLEIDGAGIGGDGIYLGGAVHNLRILDNHIHDMTGDGLKYDTAAVISGVHEVQGNLWMDNAGYEVNNLSGTIYVLDYNSWGTYAAPTNYSGVSFTTHTHLNLGFDDGDTVVADSVVLNQEISFDVLADAVKLSGGDFGMSFDPAYLQVTGLTYNTTDFSYVESCIDQPAEANAAGMVEFCGYTTGDVGLTGEDIVLFTVTFQAVQAGSTGLGFDLSDDLFTMPAQSASNNLYAAAFEIKTVSIIPLFTVSGTVDLQGRSNDSGVSVRLAAGSVWSQNYVTVSTSWKDYSYTNVTADTYSIYTDGVAGYLKLPQSLGKTVVINGNKTITDLVLYGGDVNNDNSVSIIDASGIGLHYDQNPGCVLGDCPDINNDGIVNIQDLVQVGNNFDLTSAAAYAGWVP